MISSQGLKCFKNTAMKQCSTVTISSGMPHGAYSPPVRDIQDNRH